MSAAFSPFVYQLGIGGIGGFIVGYAVKAISKLVLVLLGILAVLVLYLSMSEIININYSELWRALADLLAFAGPASSWIVGLVSLLPFMGSFLAGFAVGFKLG